MSESSSCNSLMCGHVSDGVVTQCPRCGGRMRTSRQMRTLGIIQLLIGLFLVGLMGTVTYNVAPGMLRPGETLADGSTFTGTAEQARFALSLFAAVILFGSVSMTIGLWQIITGRRNKWLVILLMLVAVALVAGWWLTMQSFEG